MRSRLLVVGILIILVAATGLTGVISRVTNGSAALRHSAASDVTVPHPEPMPQQDPEEVIDGARTPEKIPDRVAYTLLLRFLSNRKTEVEKNTARSYLRMIFGCDLCPDSSATKKQRVASQANSEKLLAIASDFESHIQPFDSDARETRGLGRLTPNEPAKTKLKKLQAKKEELVTQIMATLSTRLGPEGAKKLHDFVTQQFKRRVKIHSGNQKTPVTTLSGF